MEADCVTPYKDEVISLLIKDFIAWKGHIYLGYLAKRQAVAKFAAIK